MEKKRCLLLSTCGKPADQQSGTAFDVYYLNREQTKIVKEVFYIESQDQESQIRQLISALEAAPEDVALKSPVGTAFRITGFQVEEGGQLDLDVDEAYKKQPPTPPSVHHRSASGEEGIWWPA